MPGTLKRLEFLSEREGALPVNESIESARSALGFQPTYLAPSERMGQRKRRQSIQFQSTHYYSARGNLNKCLKGVHVGGSPAGDKIIVKSRSFRQSDGIYIERSNESLFMQSFLHTWPPGSANRQSFGNPGRCFSPTIEIRTASVELTITK